MTLKHAGKTSSEILFEQSKHQFFQVVKEQMLKMSVKIACVHLAKLYLIIFRLQQFCSHLNTYTKIRG